MDRLLTKTWLRSISTGHLQKAYDIFKRSLKETSDGELQNRMKELEEQLALSSTSPVSGSEPRAEDPSLEDG